MAGLKGFAQTRDFLERAFICGVHIERHGPDLRMRYYKRPGAPRPPRDIEREFKRSGELLFALCSYPQIMLLQRARWLATEYMLPFHEATCTAALELGMRMARPGEAEGPDVQVLGGPEPFWFEKVFTEQVPAGVTVH